ncbi:MAG: cytidyltransferase [Thiotrichaceae bacterium IS1]|nr:MAG: cytidyltransferase [Thiotrichaceae bacterium IS1]
MIASKVLTLEVLAKIAQNLREQGQKVVLCHGAFDLVHIGHIRHLRRARQEGDVLMVTVTADRYINKGPGRPVYNEALRAENLASLVWVDYVAVSDEPTAINAIDMLQPNVYVKGGDYRNINDDVTGNITKEIHAVESHGGKVVFTDELTFSSSSLLNEHFGVFSEETKQYLTVFREKYSAETVIEQIKALKKLRVLVIGDAIIDEYCYTNPLGQTGKGNVLSVKYESQEYFAGGATAVANHIAGFAGEVSLVTGLGSRGENHESFIRSRLKKNIDPVFFYFPDAPTVLKRRFVDPDMAKLFEVYFFSEEPILGDMEKRICQWLKEHARSYDMVVVPDFGNGFISEQIVNVIVENAHFLVVNTQINSGNRGYHVINRYSRMDAFSLNEPELRLAAHNRHAPLEEVAREIGTRLNCQFMAITRGPQGATVINRKTGETTTIPIFSTKVLDRIGAGDAFLSLWSICLAGGFPAELAGFVASVAAALDVLIICNREPVNPVSMFKYITTLLK